MKTFEYRSSLWVPTSPEQTFAFFADANNLQRITPPWLHFEILTPGPIDMKAGALIDYKLRLHGIPLRWQTEISTWEPPHRFVDTQRRGPYRLWVHEHRFRPERGGTQCEDHVTYAVPFGILADWLLVRRDVRRIFEFREQQLGTLLRP